MVKSSASLSERSTLVCATRSSALALWQTRTVIESLRHSGIDASELHISTKGDLVQDRSLNAIGTDNLFIKELEAALRDGRADLAVHSCKDLASSLPADMMLAAITRRADPRDAFCSQRYGSLDELPSGAVVGTSSPRRRAILAELRPDLRFETIRGNVETRLRKVRDGEYDATILAMAGLTRLGLEAAHTVALDPAAMVPAVGQGALAIECRAADEGLAAEIGAVLGDPATTLAVEAERAFLRALKAGCQAPIGAFATFAGETLTLDAALEAAAGGIIRARRTANVHTLEQAIELGEALAREVAPHREPLHAHNANGSQP
jgi:hydroxymethylbilane synthase